MKTVGAFVLGVILGGTVFAGAQNWDWQQQNQQRQAAEQALQNQRIMNGQHPITGQDMTGRRNPC